MIACIVAWGLTCVVAASADAALITVKIDDTTEGVPTVRVDGSSVTPLPDSSGEFLHFTVAFVDLAGRVAFGSSVGSDMLESANGPLSDRILLNLNLTTSFDVEFGSDPASFPPVSEIGNDIFVEDGTFQTVLDVTLGDPTAGPSDELIVQVASDAANAEVPEPGSLALLGIGVAAVFGRFRRRLAD
jgi:hypothetical protein